MGATDTSTASRTACATQRCPDRYRDPVVTRYYAAFNARDFNAYADLFGPDVDISFPGVAAQGLEAMRHFDRGWVEAFPQARLESLRMSSGEGHVASASWFHGGPQRGALNTPNGVIPATGKDLDCPAFVMFKIAGDRIVKQQLALDPACIAMQLGVAH